MFAWGATTVGIGGVRNAASLTGVRFLLGVFEAGKQSTLGYMTLVMATKLMDFQKRSLSWSGILLNLLVSTRGTFSTHQLYFSLCYVGWCLRRRHCIRCWAHEWHQQIVGLAMAFHPGRRTLVCSGSCHSTLAARLSRISSVAYR